MGGRRLGSSIRALRAVAVGAAALAVGAASAGALATAATAGATSPTVPSATARLASTTSARPPELNPIAGDQYLQEQRGTAPAATVATRYQVAVAKASALAGPRSASAAGISFTGQTWSPLGPQPATTSFYGGKNSGRVRGIAVISGTTDKVVLGSAGGGVWTATVSGATPTWKTHTDAQPDLAIGAVAVNPTDHTQLFAGTGEDSLCIDCYPSLGILESTDGGTTWTMSDPGSMFNGARVADIVVEKGKSTPATATVLAATSNGLYVSTDGGSTWTSKLAGSVTGLVVNTTTATPVVYAAVTTTGIEKSTTNGTTWTTLTTATSALPTTKATTVALGIGPTATTATTVLYASFGQVATGYGGMWKSTDGGSTWTKLASVPDFTTPSYAYTGTTTGSTAGDQGWYDNVVAVDPVDHTVVVAAGVAAVGSKNGGATWSNLNGGGYYKVATNLFHPDFHALTFDAAGNLYMGNDGGIWKLSATGVKNPTAVTAADFTNLNDSSLGITQFYANLAQNGTGAKILGGAQDNGTSYYTGSTAWKNVISGDGGDNLINPANPTEQVGEADQSLFATKDAWASTATTSTLVTAHANTTGTAWVPPLALAKNTVTPNEPTVFYGEHGALLRITTPFAAKATTKLTVGTTTKVSAIADTSTNPTILYVGFSTGAVYSTTDALATTPTFTQITGTGTTYTGWVTHISIDPATAGQILYSTSTGLVQTTLTVPPLVVKVTGADAPTPTLATETGNLPKASSNTILYDHNEYLVATDVGVFATTTLSGPTTSWAKVGTGLPNVQVIGLTLTTNGTVLAATHGRGVWKLPATATAAPTHLVVTTEPTSTAENHPFTVGVSVEDATNAVVTTDSTTTVGLTISAGTTGATLTCTGATADKKKATAGVATFNCTLNAAHTGYTLTAAATGLTSATSSSFTITAAAGAAKLIVTTEPAASTEANNPFTLTVSIETTAGAVVTTATTTVTVAVKTGTGATGAQLGCTGGAAHAAVTGVASFTCQINKVGTGYELTATSGTLTKATTATFDITPTTVPDKLAISTEPAASTVANHKFTVGVSVENTTGILLTTATTTVSLAIKTGTGTAAGALSCTGGTSKTPTAGVATFTCAITKPGTGYVVTASATARVPATTTPFTITATTTPTRLAITTEPANTAVNHTFTVGVSVENSSGTVVTTDSTTTVHLAISVGTTGATLTCTGATTDTKPTTNGVATFTCTLNDVHTGYVLTATATGLTSATTTTFTITATTTPSKLAVTTEPASSTVANHTFTVGVSVENAAGTVLTTDSTTTVHLSISAGTLTATLTCSGATTDKKAAVNGVATFSCEINNAHTGYVLTASAAGLTSATTTPAFSITATTTPAKLAVTTEPASSTVANHTFNLNVSIEDSAGLLVRTRTATHLITLAIKTGTGTLTCTTGTTTRMPGTGLVNFVGCKINKPGTFTLQATSAGLTPATTTPFTITTTTTATKLVDTTEPPTTTTVSTSFGVGVSVENVTGTVLVTKTTSVTLAIKSGTGTKTATLTCTADPEKATKGVAHFSCSINKAGAKYVLTASSGTLATATSITFTVTAPTPGGGGGGTVIPSAPGGVKATAGTAQVTLTWQPVTGATSYAVYVSTKKGGENTGGTTACTVTAPGHACTVKNLQNGTTYYFVVVTREGGASSTPSAEVSATPASALPAPANVTAIVPGSTQINVVWSPVTGATGYDVFVATSAGKENLTGTPACTVTAPTDHCSLTGLSPATTYYLVVVALQGTARSAASKEVSVTTATKTAAPGAYRFVASDGGIFTFGGAGFYGSEGTKHLNQPIVGMAQTPTGGGYWLVASDGGIFTFGNAKFMGSEGTHHLNQPIVGMAATPTGGGYWLVASDGGIFTFGNAKFLGSEGTHHLNAPIVGMAATPTGGGYWLVASDGGIFTFGNAKFLGSEGTHHLNQPIVGMAATPTGGGYWLVASDGGIFTFGNAKFLGSEGTHHLNQPIVGMAATPTGGGYWLVASDGGIFTFGNAAFSGSEGATHLNQPIVGMAA